MAVYKIEVSRELCIGDRLCCTEAPKTFDMDNDDIAVVTDPEGDPPENVLCAAKNCPVDAITLTETATGKKVWPQD